MKYYALYRLGGTARFFWSHGVINSTFGEAKIVAESLTRMGYLSLICSEAHLEEHGLPTTYDALEWIAKMVDVPRGNVTEDEQRVMNAIQASAEN